MRACRLRAGRLCVVELELDKRFRLSFEAQASLKRSKFQQYSVDALGLLAAPSGVVSAGRGAWAEESE